MKKSLDKHIRMGYGSDPENPRPRKACAGFAFMAGAPSQANGVPSANEGQSAGRPFPENRMSESRVQMYAAELAEEVNREWDDVLEAWDGEAPDFGIADPGVEAKVKAAEDWLLNRAPRIMAGLGLCVAPDATALRLRYFGDFSGVDFTPCQQIKLDPPKPRREVKPAINLAVAEDRYTGLGWCDE